jgi:hypothetical protein
VQFVLVFLAVLFFTKVFPGIVSEKIDTKTLVVKSVGIGLVVGGVVILATT